MPNRKPGQAGTEQHSMMTLGRANTAVLRGEDDPRDWDDEELRKGRPRDPDTGRFHGPDPTVVPARVQQEFMRRVTTEVRQKMAEGAGEAVDYLLGIIRDPEAPQQLRAKVAQDLLDRLGMKAPEQINLTAEEEPPWMKALQQVVIVSDEEDEPEEGDVINVGAVEPNNEDDELWDEDDDIVWEDEPSPSAREIRPEPEEPEPGARRSPLTPPKHWRDR